MKHCKGCEKDKPLSEYYLNRGSPISYCKPCWKQYSDDWRKRHPHVHRLAARRHREANLSAVSERAAKWRDRNPGWWKKYNNPKRKAAKDAVYRAIRSGRLQRPDVCEKCGCGGPIEAHHPDYDKKLDVEWLCKRCHGATRRLEQPA